MMKSESPPVRPRSIEALRKATDACRRCPLGANATQSVMGEGPLRAALMVVGEQPGDKENLSGRPFVGPAGGLLDRAIDELGWHRERLYVTNAVKHFKFELRGKRRMHKDPGAARDRSLPPLATTSATPWRRSSTPRPSSMALEILHFAFVLACLLQRVESPEISALSRFLVSLSRVKAELTGGEFANHDALL
jgi:hypothetical protein